LDDQVERIPSVRSSLVRTTIYIIVLAVSLFAVNFLFGWGTVESVPPFLQPYSTLIMLIQPYIIYIQAIVIFVFGYMAVRAVSAMAYTYARRFADHSTAAAIGTITKIAGLALLLSMLSSVFNVNPAAALTVGSFGGLVVGFATQTILSHVVAGVFLLLSRPFKHGDNVTISGKTGVVKEITLMHLVLETEEDEILVPSGSVVTQIIQKNKAV